MHGRFTIHRELPPFNYDDNFVYTKGKEPRKSTIISINTEETEQQIDLDIDQGIDEQQLSMMSQQQMSFLAALEEQDFSNSKLFQNQLELDLSKIHVQNKSQINQLSIQQLLTENERINLWINLKVIKKVRIKKVVLDVVCHDTQTVQVELKRNSKTNKFERSRKHCCQICKDCEITISPFSIDENSKEPVVILYNSFKSVEIFSIEFNKRCCTGDYTTGGDNVICYGSQKLAICICERCEKTQEVSWTQTF